MTVIETKLATDIPESHTLPVWIRFLKRLLPLSNPDFEDSYWRVNKWWVEIDDDGKPQRELGFDLQNSPIVAGPLGRNFGFWTDSDMKFVPSEHIFVQHQEFASAWAIFEIEWQKGVAGNRDGEH